MSHYSLPRYFQAYSCLLAAATFFLLLKVPFAFVPPQKELWVVISFVFESWHILWELVRYFGSLALIYAALAWWAYVLTRNTAIKLKLKMPVVYALYSLYLIWIVLTLLMANYAMHRLSGFDWLVPPIARNNAVGYISSAMWLMLGAAHLYVLKHRHIMAFIASGVLILLPAIWFSVGPMVEPGSERVALATNVVSEKKSRSEPLSIGKENGKPNIIIIGVDSFSPKHFTRYGDYILPLSTTLKSTFSFSDALATVPRTYPSWASILSGQYSKRSGIRFNLMPREREQAGNLLLSNRLQEHGYRTVFSMDERLFANFDHTYGFDEVYGPPLGASDMPLSGASDHPIANLLGHLPVMGKYLFPHTYANRAAAKSYYPEEFSTLLKNGLKKKNDKPLFLVSHFCLPHWPYFWGEQFTIPVDQRGGVANARSSSALNELFHAAAVRRVGFQVNDFIDFLNEHGYLENAILVLLSDHGENIIAGQKIKVSADLREGREMSDLEFRLLLDRTNASFNGHGVNVYDEWQVGVILGFKGYGGQYSWLGNGTSDFPTSLVDVAPTLLDLAGVSFDPLQFDGVSLTEVMRGGDAATGSRERFRVVESDLIVRALKDINKLDVAEVVKESINLYQPTADGRVELRADVVDEQLPTKVRAVYHGDWILSVSASVFDLDPLYILLNRKTGQWTDEMDGPLAKSAPLREMYNKLKSHYGSEFPDRDVPKFLN